MIKHLFKLVWNRKRANILIVAEMFFSFLVLFAVVAFGLYYADSYRQPLGFSYENVWNIFVISRASDPQNVLTTKQMLYQALKDLNEVEAVAGAQTAVPYESNRSRRRHSHRGRSILVEVGRVTDDFKEVLGLKIIHGRWFEKADDALGWDPVIINQRFSREMFGSEDPLGKNIASAKAIREVRVVGVVSDFRKHGELSQSVNFLLERILFQKPSFDNFMIRVRPGAPATFEEKLMAQLQAIVQDWTFHIRPMSQMRASYLKLRLAPLITAGLIAAFLMMIVGLGLMGVLYQNVTQRTKEIGLRRANGATAEHIYKQILGELLVITTFGVAAGTLIIVQFPLLRWFAFISGKVYIISLAISVAMMYLLTVLCGLYPARLATKVHPAEALHYE